MKMSKLTIPTILTATIIVAAIFAFAPIDQASTVHDNIVAAVAQETAIIYDAATIADPGDSATSTVDLADAATAGNTIAGTVCFEITTVDSDTATLQVTTSDGVTQILNVAANDLDAGCQVFAGQDLETALLEVGDNTAADATVDGIVYFTESSNVSTDTDLDDN